MYYHTIVFFIPYNNKLIPDQLWLAHIRVKGEVEYKFQHIRLEA